MATISVLGVDLGKNVCSVVGFDGAGKVVMRRKVRRETLIGLAAKLPPCMVAMEACCGAHHLGRIFAAHGHEVRLMSPEYVRPYVKAQKNDDRDAEGIAEAATRPFDALCQPEEPGSARHADAALIERAAGRRADGPDQSAARDLAGARYRGAEGQTEAREVSG
jgi:transposase